MKRQYIKRGKPETKLCKQCSATIIRPYKMTIKCWEKKQFCSQKCNGLARVGKPQLWTHRVFSKTDKQEVSNRMKGNQHAKGHKHTNDAKARMSINRSGPKHWDWKGDAATYSAFHKWLAKNFGVATKCENKLCNSGSDQFDYAKIRGKNHSHNRENYINLCRPCHKSYDLNNGKIRFEL